MPITIKPIKKKRKKPLELLSEENFKYIQNVLERSCVNNICISMSQLYTELKDHIILNIEEHQFNVAIREAIKAGIIKGFKTRTGRNGGICRVDAFPDSASRNKRNKNQPCTIYVNNTLYKLKVSENHILALILSVLEAIPSNDGRGNIYINNASYRLPNNIKLTKILENYILNLCEAEKIDNPDVGTFFETEKSA